VSQSTQQDNTFDKTDSGWKNLYKVGGAAALIAVVIFRRHWSAELSLLGGLGLIRGVPATAPTSALDWFSLLQSNRLVGLILLDVCDLINYALVCLIFLALTGVLSRASRSATLITTACVLVATAVTFASNQAFAMLRLSDQYVAATTGAQQAMALAAGEALLAIQGTGTIWPGSGYCLSLFLVLLAGLIISVVMLRSRIFGRAAAWSGILANVFGLAYFVFLAVAPALRAIPLSVSAPFRLAWYILIARKLLQLARTEDVVASNKENPTRGIAQA
jgi:hypothetical protein